QLVLIVTSTNGVVHDTASPRISLDVRSGHPAPRDGYYTGSHLDGSHTHGRICPVTLRNRGYPVGGFHRLAGGRSILGLGKCVFRDRRQRGADRAVRFADPADDRRRWSAAVGKHCEPGFRDTAILDRGGPGVSHRGWHLPRALGGRTPALAICAACRDWRRHDWLLCRRRSRAAGAKGAWRSKGAYGWCLFGIADLVVAVTMGALTSPGRAHLLAFDAPNLLISSYPLVMVPTFAVPLALMLHGLVFWRLRRKGAPTGRLAAA